MFPALISHLAVMNDRCAFDKPLAPMTRRPIMSPILIIPEAMSILHKDTGALALQYQVIKSTLAHSLPWTKIMMKTRMRTKRSYKMISTKEALDSRHLKTKDSAVYGNPPPSRAGRPTTIGLLTAAAATLITRANALPLETCNFLGPTHSGRAPPPTPRTKHTV